MSWREDAIAEAKTWLWTPFLHRARVKGVGVDCGGLLYEVYQKYLPLPEFPKYSEDWMLHRSEEVYLSFIGPFAKEVPVPVPGGFTVFKIGRTYSHAGIFTGSSYIHANRAGRAVKEDAPVVFARHEKKHFDLEVV